MKNRHSDKSPEFPFCFIYPRRGAGEAGNLEIPTDANQKAPTNSLPSLAKGKGKGSLARKKTSLKLVER